MGCLAVKLQAVFSFIIFRKSTSFVVSYPAVHTKTSLRLLLREEYNR